MKCKDENGKEMVVTVCGRYEDDLQIDDAYYVDSDDRVSDETIEYVYENYADAMYEEWYEGQIGRAEAYFEGDR